MTRPRVLLVEDDFLIRLTLVEALDEEGFDVTEATSGDEASAVLDGLGGDGQDRFALLVTDVQLPGRLSGLALADAARARHPDLPVLFTTGRPDVFDGRPSRSQEAIVAKPYAPSAICETARRLLAHHLLAGR